MVRRRRASGAPTRQGGGIERFVGAAVAGPIAAVTPWAKLAIFLAVATILKPAQAAGLSVRSIRKPGRDLTGGRGATYCGPHAMTYTGSIPDGDLRFAPAQAAGSVFPFANSGAGRDFARGDGAGSLFRPGGGRASGLPTRWTVVSDVSWAAP
jgi:hypothetical protein